MPISAKEVLDQLAALPHRGCGSEEEEEARERIAALLERTPGVFVADQGFFGPRTYLRFFWGVIIAILISLWIFPLLPMVVALFALSMFGSLVWFLDWRRMPLVWLGARTLTANLVATPERERRPLSQAGPLVILMAHLDSAPASYAYRKEQVGRFKLSFFMGIGLLGLAPLAMLFAALAGTGLGTWAVPLALITVVPGIVSSLDFWLHGFTPGGNDNASGVAAAVAAASRLWEDSELRGEVRLVLTSAEEAGMLGAQHYLSEHLPEFRVRPTYVINIDSVGAGALAHVTRTGAITHTVYRNKLTKLAAAWGLPEAEHHVGDFDSVWFARAGLPAVTLAAYTPDGLMPYIHTPQDGFAELNPEVIEQAAEAAEAIALGVIKGEMPPKSAKTRGVYA